VNAAHVLRGMRDHDLAKYAKRCVREAGFTLTVDGDSHIRLTAPDGRWARLSGTQHTGEATHRAKARLRRIGGPR